MQTGSLVVDYEIDIVELNSLPEFAVLKYFELGDTVRMIDAELGIDELQRIIRYEYDPWRRIKSKVTITANLGRKPLCIMGFPLAETQFNKEASR